MLRATQFQKLKQTNVSKDSDKTRVRIDEDYKAATKIQKNDIKALSGLVNSNFYNAAKRGTASAKVVLSLAQVLNVSPYYYMGVTDEKGEFTEELLQQFLNEHGYNKNKDRRPYSFYRETPTIGRISDEPRAEVKPEKTEAVYPEIKPAESKPALGKPDTAYSLEFDNSPQMNEAVKKLDYDTASLLMNALYKRAEAGGYASNLLETVKRCLLS